MFFVQNAGAPAAGTGLAKSAVIQKISLSAITTAITSKMNASGSIEVEVVNSNPTVMNPNGACEVVFYMFFLTPGTLTEDARRNQLQRSTSVPRRGPRREHCSVHVSHEPGTSLQHHR
jgi:hypothetical protein